MITSSKEYYDLLYLIQDMNPPETAVLIPKDEPIFRINLDSRTIEAPTNFSVATDHRAETIFFRVNRYYDNVDLSSMCCVIQFVNANKVSGIYPVPFYDIDSLTETNEMLIPWVIDGTVTEKAGKVTFSLQFFRVAEGSGKYTYNLNTVTQQFEVLKGNDFDKTATVKALEKSFGKTLEELAKDGTIDLKEINAPLANAYEVLINKMNDIQGQLNIYWLEE